tara:strand:+ start:1963 stop:2073 length:111 start_codon:yes stop_codon:yes gene_type:complete
MWMFLQYIKDTWDEATPWLYAVAIVTVSIIILGVAL